METCCPDGVEPIHYFLITREKSRVRNAACTQNNLSLLCAVSPITLAPVTEHSVAAILKSTGYSKKEKDGEHSAAVPGCQTWTELCSFQ